MAAKHQRRRWSTEEKAAILRDFEKSGLSQQRFAAQAGIHASLIGKWRLAAHGAEQSLRSSALIPVRIAQPRRDESERLEVVLAGGRRVRVPRGFDADELVRLVEVLDRC